MNQVEIFNVIIDFLSQYKYTNNQPTQICGYDIEEIRKNLDTTENVVKPIIRSLLSFEINGIKLFANDKTIKILEERSRK